MTSRTRSRALLLLAAGAVALVAVGACSKDNPPASGNAGEAPKPATSAAPESAQAAQPAAAPANTGFGVPLAANKCPSAVPGSTTTVKDLPDGIEVTVLAPSGLPINDIRQRGQQLITAMKDPATGAGSAADGLAKCPVVVRETTVTETDVPGGATFTVKPMKATNLIALQKDTKAKATGYTP